LFIFEAEENLKLSLSLKKYFNAAFILLTHFYHPPDPSGSNGQSGG